MRTEPISNAAKALGLEGIWTRREVVQALGALALSLAVGVPIAGKFIRDARALTGHLTTEVQEAELATVPEADLETVPDPVVLPQAEESIRPAPLTLAGEMRNGLDLLKGFGLRGKVVYIVYGRPSKQGETTWGTLGGSRTAEESWQLVRASARAIGKEIGKDESDFALHVLNPVYRSQNGVIEDIYIQRALELAPANHGLVAINFNSIGDARETIQRLESVFPKALLSYLAVGLDVEHFPGGQTDAASLNDFSLWFGQKHVEWTESGAIPGLVLVYTFRGAVDGGQGKIENLGQLVQYHLPQRTLVVPVFDGYGSSEAKLGLMGGLVRALVNQEQHPALVGVMEFTSRWGTKYDQATIEQTFATLQGAPVYFFASQ
jgi:hypothetical protein